jgi:endo-1,4-beta-xylanase
MTNDRTRPPGRRRTVGGVVAAAITIAAVAAVPATSHAVTTLKSLAEAKGRDIGFALATDRLGEPAYRSIADAEFTMVVAENAMKWGATEPSRGAFRWTDADVVAGYAAQTGKKLYGHNLVWHEWLPAWVGNIPSGQDLLRAMKDHIAGVAGRYQGKVVAWDVVNEAFNEDGSRRDSIFQQRIGNSYLEEAFRAAHAADPAADLCYNDYNIESVNNKSNAVYNLVSDFKARGVPIDCVGFQSHFALNQVPDMRANLQRFADLGVDVRITELDIRMPLPADATKLARQADDYRTVVTACLAVSRCVSVTTWGLTDRYSWIPGYFPGQGAALMFDDAFARKPAYDAVAQAFGAGPVPSPTTPAPPSAGCQVSYPVNQWNTGFTADVTITNTAGAAVEGWTLTFTFTAGQTITSAWNATVGQSGGQVTARNAAWNGTIGAGGGRTSFGFQATHTGSNPAPAGFALNGTACAVV